MIEGKNGFAADFQKLRTFFPNKKHQINANGHIKEIILLLQEAKATHRRQNHIFPHEIKKELINILRFKGDMPKHVILKSVLNEDGEVSIRHNNNTYSVLKTGGSVLSHTYELETLHDTYMRLDLHEGIIGETVYNNIRTRIFFHDGSEVLGFDIPYGEKTEETRKEEAERQTDFNKKVCIDILKDKDFLQEVETILADKKIYENGKILEEMTHITGLIQIYHKKHVFIERTEIVKSIQTHCNNLEKNAHRPSVQAFLKDHKETIDEITQTMSQQKT